MARREVLVDGKSVLLAMDDARRAGSRSCALLRVRVEDDTTGAPTRAALAARLVAPASDAIARSVAPGLVGVAGRPAAAFASAIATTERIEVELAAPRFATGRVVAEFACHRRSLTAAATAAVLVLDSAAGLEAAQRLLIEDADGTTAEIATIAATGPGANQVTLAAAPGYPFPAGSVVHPLPGDRAVALRPRPVTISGRVLKRSGTTTQPLAGAAVRVSKVWRRNPLAGTTVDPELPVPGGPVPGVPWDPPIAALWPPAYADVPKPGTITVEDRPVDGAVAAKALLNDVAVGALHLRLSNADGLAVSSVIAVDASDPERREIVTVAAIAPSGGPADWARVRLDVPLALDHRRGRPVRLMGAPGGAAPIALNDAVAAGDEAVLFDATGLAGSHQVRLDHAGPPVVATFHRITVLAATSDADGFYRLPPIARVGRIEINARDAGSAAKTAVELAPDYDLPENHLDLVVR